MRRATQNEHNMLLKGIIDLSKLYEMLDSVYTRCQNANCANVWIVSFHSAWKLYFPHCYAFTVYVYIYLYIFFKYMQT